MENETGVSECTDETMCFICLMKKELWTDQKLGKVKIKINGLGFLRFDCCLKRNIYELSRNHFTKQISFLRAATDYSTPAQLYWSSPTFMPIDNLWSDEILRWHRYVADSRHKMDKLLERVSLQTEIATGQ